MEIDTHFEKKWSFSPSPLKLDSDDNIFDSKPILSADESTIYAASSVEGFVRAFNVGGNNDDDRVVWEFGPANITAILAVEANNPDEQAIEGHAIYSSPTLSRDGKTLYFVGYSAFLIALDASNGELKWISSQHKGNQLGNSIRIVGSPVLSNDKLGSVIYLGTEIGLGAYSAADGSRIWVDGLTNPRIFHEFRVTSAVRHYPTGISQVSSTTLMPPPTERGRGTPSGTSRVGSKLPHLC